MGNERDGEENFGEVIEQLKGGKSMEERAKVEGIEKTRDSKRGGKKKG